MAPSTVRGDSVDPLRYTLTGQSTLINDCLPCGRPTILEQLRGTFSLSPNASASSSFQITNIHWTSYRGTNVTSRITGSGTFSMDQKSAPSIQQMRLVLMIDNGFTNETVVLTNNPSSATNPWPVIDINLTEQTKSLFRVYELHLLAYPIVDLWFSGAKPFAPGNSTGDLLSYNSAQTVLSAKSLTKSLGELPPGNHLDALTLATNGEVYFSLTQDFTNAAGTVFHHGDLLSNHGIVVSSNEQLLRSFGRDPVVEDAGLDALFLSSDGKIFFSISKSQFSGNGARLTPGDILSENGLIVRTGSKLLENFKPISSTTDPGLDAFYIWPSGEIWFSTENDFETPSGPISAGDILSDQGYVVFKNADLSLAFPNADPAIDHGLTALYIVSDFVTASQPPDFGRPSAAPGIIQLNWAGMGKVFQLESASALGTGFELDGGLMVGTNAIRSIDSTSKFFRLRQW